MEVVSDGTETRRRDDDDKRRDYAKANIAEYWIIDLRDEVANGKLLSVRAVDVTKLMNV